MVWINGPDSRGKALGRGLLIEQGETITSDCLRLVKWILQMDKGILSLACTMCKRSFWGTFLKKFKSQGYCKRPNSSSV